MPSHRESVAWIEPRKAWRWIGGTLLVCVTCSIALGVWLRYSGERELAAELDAWRSEGAAINVAELPPFEARRGVHPATWWPPQSAPTPMTSLGALGYAPSMSHFGAALRPVIRAPIRPLPIQTGHALYTSTACQPLFDKLRSDERAFWDFVDTAMSKEGKPDEWLACVEAAYRAALDADVQGFERALESCNVAQFDRRGWFESDSARGPFGEIEGADGRARAVALLCYYARAEALVGRASEARRAIDNAFCVASIVEGVPTLTAYEEWSRLESAVLIALVECASFLPPDTDWSSWEHSIDALRPLENRRLAVEGEFVLARALYKRYAKGDPTGLPDVDAQDGMRAIWAWAMLAHDESAYLHALRRHRAEVSLAPHEHAASSATPSAAPNWTSIANRLWSSTTVDQHPWAELEARRRIARMCLRVRRDGAGAVATVSAGDPFFEDPFDGRPLRSRADAFGSLVIWSVGANLKDDGGASTTLSSTAAPDIVARVRLP